MMNNNNNMLYFNAFVLSSSFVILVSQEMDMLDKNCDNHFHQYRLLIVPYVPQNDILKLIQL